MVPEIEIRLIHNEEYEQANTFYNAVHGTNRTFEQFRWEFIEGPGGPAIYVVAVDKSTKRIVGTQCAIPIEWIDPDGNVILTAKSEDTLIHPSYRGLKIFEKMYDLLFAECKRNGIVAIWGFTYAIKPFAKVGFAIPYHQIQGLYVFSPIRAFNIISSLNANNTFLTKLKIAGFTALSWLTGVFSKTANKSKVETTFNTIGSSLSVDVAKAVSGQYFLSENQKYIEWRLLQNPYENDYFEICGLGENGDSQVSIILNFKNKDVCYLEQIIFNTSENQLIESTLTKAIQFAKSKGVAMIRFWAFDYSEKQKTDLQFITNAGFKVARRGISFVWYDFSQKIDPNQIYLNRIYTQGNL
ncbi:MAG: GNAT family N-acetyltransferase [Chitinophagales bacterium]